MVPVMSFRTPIKHIHLHDISTPSAVYICILFIKLIQTAFFSLNFIAILLHCIRYQWHCCFGLRIISFLSCKYILLAKRVFARHYGNSSSYRMVVILICTFCEPHFFHNLSFTAFNTKDIKSHWQWNFKCQLTLLSYTFFIHGQCE